MMAGFNRPYGTLSVVAASPALKCWAMVATPLAGLVCDRGDGVHAPGFAVRWEVKCRWKSGASRACPELVEGAASGIHDTNRVQALRGYDEECHGG